MFTVLCKPSGFPESFFFWVTLLWGLWARGSKSAFCPLSSPPFIVFPFLCGFCGLVCLPVCLSTLFALVAKLTAWTKFPHQPKGNFRAITHVSMNLIWKCVAEQLHVVNRSLWALLESDCKDCEVRVCLRRAWPGRYRRHTRDTHLCMLLGQLPQDGFLNMAPSLLLSLPPSSRLSFLHDRASDSPHQPRFISFSCLLFFSSCG